MLSGQQQVYNIACSLFSVLRWMWYVALDVATCFTEVKNNGIIVLSGKWMIVPDDFYNLLILSQVMGYNYYIRLDLM